MPTVLLPLNYIVTCCTDNVANDGIALEEEEEYAEESVHPDLWFIIFHARHSKGIHILYRVSQQKRSLDIFYHKISSTIAEKGGNFLFYLGHQSNLFLLFTK